MNRQTYIEILRNNLTNLSYEEIEEIINDVNEHYTIGLEEGKTEEEISKLLGSPIDMAKLYTTNTIFEEEVIVEPQHSTPKDAPTSGSNEFLDILIKLFVIFIIITVIIPTVFSIYATLISFYAVGIGLIVTGIASFIAIFGIFGFITLQLSIIGGLLLGIGSLMCGYSVILLTTRLLKGFTLLLKKGYVWLKGGFKYGFI